MSAITTHVLDMALGVPAAGIPVRLEARQPDGRWELIGQGITDADGRQRGLMPEGDLEPGEYRLIYDVDAYSSSPDRRAFFPEIVVTFRTAPGQRRYHVPLLLSPFGYSTYRGS